MDNIISQFESLNIIKTGIIYSRSSSKKQNDYLTNSNSLETQISSCVKHCINENINILKIEKEIVSARNGDKQKILLDIINSNKNILLIIFDISRFSRNIFDGMDMLKKCIDKKIIIYSLKDNFYVKDFNDITKFNNILSNAHAHAESDAISFRVKKSIEFRKSKGEFLGKRRFGYDVVKEDNKKKLKVNNQEQNIIELILKLKYGGLKKDIINLISFLPEFRSIIVSKLDDVILFGNYENSDIALFFNENNILNKGYIWTSKSIDKLCELEFEKIDIRDEKTDELLTELFSLNFDKKLIKKLFFEINGYDISLNKLSKCNNFDNKMKFLNDNYLNFQVWNNDSVKNKN